MAVGLNTIREIFSRCHLAMNEDLLHDLSKYKSYRDKSVSASGRSLIQVFREKNQHLLEQNDRAKPTEFQRDLVPPDYRQYNPKTYLEDLEGAELLADNDTTAQKDQMEEDNHDDETDDKNSEDGWINVSDSDDDKEEEEGNEERRTTK